MTFHSGAEKTVEWLFSRELLTGGVRTPVVVGDVRVRPSTERTGTVYRSRLARGRYTDAMLGIPATDSADQMILGGRDDADRARFAPLHRRDRSQGTQPSPPIPAEPGLPTRNQEARRMPDAADPDRTAHGRNRPPGQPPGQESEVRPTSLTTGPGADHRARMYRIVVARAENRRTGDQIRQPFSPPPR
ncbi:MULTISPECIES: SsgA family sporulation/cell division regulator [unclassified Streptomyces]|uniref:SsgA family sporulation/cell division regulator n=1 Tax=unclassified Streptomyces TaxID=2593676 RepID=UPI0038013C16